jgi:Ty3 transposon capsid-like protein
LNNHQPLLAAGSLSTHSLVPPRSRLVIESETEQLCLFKMPAPRTRTHDQAAARDAATDPVVAPPSDLAAQEGPAIEDPTEQQLGSLLTLLEAKESRNKALEDRNEVLAARVAQLECLERDAHAIPANSSPLMLTAQRSIDQLASPVPRQEARNTYVPPREDLHVPDPKRFDGKRDKLRPFLTAVRIVIRVRRNAFQDNQAKILYVGTLLEDSAFRWFENILREMDSPCPPAYCLTFESFCRELERTFGDPDERRSAVTKLERLRQRGPAHEYKADFLALAPITGWDDHALCDAFYKGLKPEVKDELALLDSPDSLEQLMRRTISIDNRRLARAQERQAEAPGSPFRTRRDVSDTVPRQATGPRASAPTSSAPKVMPRTAPSRSRKIAPEERQRRLDNDLCVYCGGAGHYAAKCPSLNEKNRSTSGPATSHSSGTIKARATFESSAALTEEDSSDAEPLKEFIVQ